MKRALLLVCLLLAACASTPTNRWAQARVTLTSAEKTALAAHRSGLISDGILVRSDGLVKTARAALDKAELQLPEGGSVFEILMSAADEAIKQIEAMAATTPASPGLIGALNELRERYAALEAAWTC